MHNYIASGFPSPAEESQNEERSQKLMEVMDNINAKFGRHTIKLGSVGVKQSWIAKSDRRSPRYTTC